jgi:hypothetical protein
MMARIDEETLGRHIEENERQIMRLQAEMSEASQITNDRDDGQYARRYRK